MKCPFCLETFQGENVLGRHIFEHSKVEISLKLAELLSKQQQDEDMIPVSEIKAKIKKFESMLTDKIKDGKIIDHESWDYIDQARLLTIQYLKDLLKEKEKPKQYDVYEVGPEAFEQYKQDSKGET
jgi:hypothetical protein